MLEGCCQILAWLARVAAFLAVRRKPFGIAARPFLTDPIASALNGVVFHILGGGPVEAIGRALHNWVVCERVCILDMALKSTAEVSRLYE